MKNIKYFLYLTASILTSLNLLGEGTRELVPINGGANGGSLQIIGNVNKGSAFAAYGGAATQRLNIHICKIGEVINLGFETLPDWYFRLLDPTGTVVIPERSLNFNAVNSPGRINNYNQAVAGPNTLNPAGYVPITYTANTTGDFYIELRTSVPAFNIVDLWDITVTQNSLEKKGRVWGQSWLLTTNGPSNKFNANLYVYTTDKITTKINFNGIQPFEFIISSNSTGTGKNGTVAQNRQSVFGNNTYPEYKIFLNEPDTNCYATGDLGEIDGDPYITGCPGNYCINVSVTAPGNMQFLIDVNGTPGFQNNTADKLIQANLKKGYNCVPWDGKDGIGNLVTSATTIDLSIQYMNGLTHLPIFDVENQINGYSISYVRPVPLSAGANIDVYWDDTRINTDGNQLDGLTNLNGCKPANGCHKWSNRGGNNNNSPTVNTWWFVKESSASIAYEDNNVAVDANIYKPGKGSKNDISYCASIDSVLINGGEDGDGFIKWTSLVGTGSFADDTLLTNYYKLSAADKLRPFVQLRIQNKVGVCPPVYDTIKIFLEPQKNLDLQPVADKCKDLPNFTISATKSNILGTIRWTNAGTILQTSASTALGVTPTASDLLKDSITIKATSNDVVVHCPNVSDSVKVKFYTAASITLPKDTTFCTGTLTLNLPVNAKTTNNPTSITWLAINATPTPNTGASTSLDLSGTSAQVRLIATATKTGCNPRRDTMFVNFTEKPIVDVLDVNPLCSTVDSITLNSNVTNTSNSLWKGGSGLFKNKNILKTVYFPSLTEKTSGGDIILTLLANGNSTCKPDSDKTVINLIPLPELNGKNFQGFCADIDSIQVISFSKNTTGILWQGSGGYFNNPNKDTTFYHPNKTELSNGQTTLFLTATAKTPCNNLKDTINAIFVLPPFVTIDSVGPFCADINSIPLTAKVQNASNILWTGGTGTLANNSSTNTIYSPSIAEKKGSSFPISLIATANAPCKNIGKSFKLTINPLPMATNTTVPFCNEGDNSILIDGGDASKYLWLSSRDTTRKTIVTEYKTFEVKVENQFGCEAIRTINTFEECPPRLFISNGFSPNGDEVNDIYTVYGAHIGKFEMLIFSRWGEVIFRSTDINKAWDGTYKDEPMPLGTYQWKIEYEGDTETYKGPYFKKGSVTIVR